MASSACFQIGTNAKRRTGRRKTEVTRFALYDQSEELALAPEVEAFLSAGDKPIFLRPAPPMRTGESFLKPPPGALAVLEENAAFSARAFRINFLRTCRLPFCRWSLCRSRRSSRAAPPSCITAASARAPRAWPRAFRSCSCRWRMISRTTGRTCASWAFGDYLYPRKFKPRAIAAKLQHMTTAREVAQRLQRRQTTHRRANVPRCVLRNRRITGHQGHP